MHNNAVAEDGAGDIAGVAEGGLGDIAVVAAFEVPYRVHAVAAQVAVVQVLQVALRVVPQSGQVVPLVHRAAVFLVHPAVFPVVPLALREAPTVKLLAVPAVQYPKMACRIDCRTLLLLRHCRILNNTYKESPSLKSKTTYY